MIIEDLTDNLKGARRMSSKTKCEKDCIGFWEQSGMPVDENAFVLRCASCFRLALFYEHIPGHYYEIAQVVDSGQNL